MAAAYDVEGSECETSLKREVVVERRRLQERLEVGTFSGMWGFRSFWVWGSGMVAAMAF
jgi:hypothetical protein